LLSDKIRQKLADFHRQHLYEKEIRSLSYSETEEGVRLDDVIAGKEIEVNEGKFLLYERPLELLVSNSDEVHSEYLASLTFCRQQTEFEPHPDVRSILEYEPDRICFLDIETTGLGTGAAFLVGLITWDTGSLTLRQLLARDYSEEPPLLAYLAALFDRYEAMVSFNGKSFDLRYIQERLIANGIPYFVEFDHLDLLHEGRRHWKHELPNCRLQTLEKHISGRERIGDIPGADIPDAYHDFVKSGDARQIKEIVHHNALDLITLVEVLSCVLRRPPVKSRKRKNPTN
jgi:uncharacterized protein YprB with RNaseH-like and TPR domain